MIVQNGQAVYFCYSTHEQLFNVIGVLFIACVMLFLYYQYRRAVKNNNEKMEQDLNDLYEYFRKELTSFIGDEEIGYPIGEAKKSNLSPSTRFDVFQRDNFTCQLCGKTREEGAKLEADHKIPVSKGGSNRMGNLWTLCRECNAGKTDKILHQWLKFYRMIDMSSRYYGRRYSTDL